MCSPEKYFFLHWVWSGKTPLILYAAENMASIWGREY